MIDYDLFRGVKTNPTESRHSEGEARMSRLVVGNSISDFDLVEKLTHTRHLLLLAWPGVAAADGSGQTPERVRGGGLGGSVCLLLPSLRGTKQSVCYLQ